MKKYFKLFGFPILLLVFVAVFSFKVNSVFSNVNVSVSVDPINGPNINVTSGGSAELDWNTSWTTLQCQEGCGEDNSVVHVVVYNNTTNQIIQDHTFGSLSAGQATGSYIAYNVTQNASYTVEAIVTAGGDQESSQTNFTVTVVSSPVPGACAATHYNCSSTAASTGTGYNSNNWTWTCPGLNQGKDASCSESFPTGTISGSACSVSSSTGTCTSTITWTVAGNSPAYVEVRTGTGALFASSNGSGSSPLTVSTTPVVLTLYDETVGSPNHGKALATTTVTATGPTSYTVSSTGSGVGGTITPTSQSVVSGSTTTFTVIPAQGYSASASGCGGSLPPGGTVFTTGAITSSCTVTATFTLIPTGGCNIVGFAYSSSDGTMNWQTTNCSSISLNGSSEPASGSQGCAGGTTYKLVADTWASYQYCPAPAVNANLPTSLTVAPGGTGSAILNFSNSGESGSYLNVNVSPYLNANSCSVSVSTPGLTIDHIVCSAILIK